MVVSFTLSCVIVMMPCWSWYTGKDRSRMILPWWPTCGTMATGEIFRFAGRSFLRSSHRYTLQKPALIWYSMSTLKRGMESWVLAVG